MQLDVQARSRAEAEAAAAATLKAASVEAAERIASSVAEINALKVNWSPHVGVPLWYFIASVTIYTIVG